VDTAQFISRAISLLLISGISTSTFADSKASSKRPNILLINVDDMGWRDVGFMGSKYYETPNIDQLATKGLVFTDAYAAAANCAPSRACMMSGQWTPRHGIYTVANSDRGKAADRKLIPIANNETLSDQNKIIAEVLQDAGYATCMAGKWHLTDDPTKRGFDVNIGGSHAGSPGSYTPPYKNIPLDPPTNDYDLTRLITDRSIDFLKTVMARPFFLYYAPYAVHTPLQPVKELMPKYAGKAAWNGQNNPVYATMVENLDTQIGRVITFLTENNLLQNTFILLTSDNGGVYNITKQWPLRAGKGSCYEGGIREPMVVCWPGMIKAGTISEVPVTNLDFFPTLLDVAGIVLDPGKVLDGKSLVPVLTGKGVIAERPLFWHFPVYLEGGNMETQDSIFRTRPGSSVRLGDWKLIQYFENNDLELYNLREDIGEKVNRFRSDPAKTTELLAILEKWRRETNAPVPVALNPSFAKP
jgi:arylsulfatase A-like enzyme